MCEEIQKNEDLKVIYINYFGFREKFTYLKYEKIVHANIIQPVFIIQTNSNLIFKKRLAKLRSNKTFKVLSSEHIWEHSKFSPLPPPLSPHPAIINTNEPKQLLFVYTNCMIVCVGATSCILCCLMRGSSAANQLLSAQIFDEYYRGGIRADGGGGGCRGYPPPPLKFL